MANDFLFTSESVSEGHPDKVADQISDAILDAIFKQDPLSRVAAETLTNTGLVVLAGEITTNAHVDYIQVARDTIKRIGYDNTDYGIDYKGCAVMVCYDKQSNDIAQGVAVCNAYAAEHLEVVTENAPGVAAQITSAGAIFVGDYSPVSLGDYCAGSNHVLPTSGTAAFSSGLNVTTFLRAVQLINYNKEALAQVAGHVITLSRAEGLPAHGDAVAVRFP